MAVLKRRFSRRSLLVSCFAVHSLAAESRSRKGQTFESEWERYADPTTEFQVYRLTDPSYGSTLPDSHNRIISGNSGMLLYCCDRSGSPQAFRMNLKSGDTQQLTDRPGLDGATLTLTPDSRSICYFADRTLYLANIATLRERPIYTVPEGWERMPGLSVSAARAIFAEKRAGTSRLRSVNLAQGVTRTILEVPFLIRDPLERPQRPQILYRQPGKGLWLVNADGSGNRELKLSQGVAGSPGPAYWSANGNELLYLDFPEDPKELNTIREYTPEQESDKLIAKTSQYAQFGCNRDTSVFVGASRNKASPVILLMLRVTRRELTLCEHRASNPATVVLVFAPDAQRIYFQSDRHGKPAIYGLHVERLVEKIEDGTA